MFCEKDDKTPGFCLGSTHIHNLVKQVIFSVLQK